MQSLEQSWGGHAERVRGQSLLSLCRGGPDKSKGMGCWFVFAWGKLSTWERWVFIMQISLVWI